MCHLSTEFCEHRLSGVFLSNPFNTQTNQLTLTETD